MRVKATDVVYTMLPTDDFLPFVISGTKEQPNFFDKKQVVLNVEFQITAPGYDKRKVWRNFGPFWPKAGSDKTTLFFDLVKAVDPAEAVRGRTYESDNLIGKKGKLIMEDYETKELVPMEIPVLDDNGEETEETQVNPDPRRGLPVIKQKIKLILPLKSGSIADIAPEAPVQEPVTAAAAGKKIKF